MEVGQSESPLHQRIACCNSAQQVLRRRNQRGCPSVATAHRVLQRRSAGSCDDATNTVTNPLQQRIAGCSSAQPVRATTQPTRLPIHCNSASRVATALSRFVRRRSQRGCPSVATAHRGLQQRSAGSCDDATYTVAHPLRRRIAGCNGAQFDNAALLHQSAVGCNSASRVAAANNSVAEQIVAPLVAVQPAVAQPNLL